MLRSFAAATFKVCIERRYKLNKTLRELHRKHEHSDDADAVRQIEQALVLPAAR